MEEKGKKKGKKKEVKKKKSQAPSKQSIDWTGEHQKCLEDLINVLTSSKVMAYPDFEQPFVLHVDASQDGLGGILYQKREDGSDRLWVSHSVSGRTKLSLTFRETGISIPEVGDYRPV